MSGISRRRLAMMKRNVRPRQPIHSNGILEKIIVTSHLNDLPSQAPVLVDIPLDRMVYSTLGCGRFASCHTYWGSISGSIMQ